MKTARPSLKEVTRRRILYSEKKESKGTPSWGMALCRHATDMMGKGGERRGSRRSLLSDAGGDLAVVK